MPAQVMSYPRALLPAPCASQYFLRYFTAHRQASAIQYVFNAMR
jgi:hypothetical protein